MSWWNVPYNNIFGRAFTNKEFLVSKSYSLGSKITQKLKLKCNICKDEMDQF